MSESEAIVELLSAPKTFAAIIPDAPADVLQSAFLAQNGTVCLIALDDLRLFGQMFGGLLAPEDESADG